MSGMLQLPAIVQSQNTTQFRGTFDACLDVWVALPPEDRHGASITLDGSIPENAAKVRWPMDATDIAKAVLMRENSECP